MRPLPASVSDWATEAGYSAAWQLVRTMPEPVARHAFRRAADLASRRGGRSTQQLRRNLARVVGPSASARELDQLVRDGMRSYARYWLETFRLPAMNVAETVARVSTVGADHVDAAATSGRGAIFALPHSGNWDIAGLWLVQRGYPFTTVAERLKPETLFDKFVAFREGLGMEVLALTGGARSPMEVMRQRLAAGGVVCLVADRDLSRGGIDVEFFGERTRMPAGPALLAATTGAALLPAHLYFDGDGWGQWIGPPIELGDGNLRSKVTIGTQRLADAFAEHIAAYPSDWHMLQRLWLADLDQARLKAVDFNVNDHAEPALALPIDSAAVPSVDGT
jgi:lauroyl/myristoyl acyltransferase